MLIFSLLDICRGDIISRNLGSLFPKANALIVDNELFTMSYSLIMRLIVQQVYAAPVSEHHARCVLHWMRTATRTSDDGAGVEATTQASLAYGCLRVMPVHSPSKRRGRDAERLAVIAYSRVCAARGAASAPLFSYFYNYLTKGRMLQGSKFNDISLNHAPTHASSLPLNLSRNS